MLNLYNRDPDALAKARTECQEKGIDPAVIDRAETALKSKKAERRNALPDKTTRQLYAFLKSRYPDTKHDELVKCVLRYAALGMGGQQWATAHEMMDRIHRAGIHIEAFASPFNRYFTHYYSVFKADTVFGSRGSFFDAPESELQQGVYANPPFTEYMLRRMTEKVCRLPRAVLVTPTWTDAVWYSQLRRCGFRPHLKKDAVYTALGEEFRPRFTTTVWTKNVDLKI